MTRPLPPSPIDAIDTGRAAGNGPRVLGPVIDSETRCVHYRTALDVIAIRFACCGEFYPCHLCHAETADHPARPWPVEDRGRRAVLCGVCSHQLTITEYLCTDRCPSCDAAFNPGCKLHAELYFEPDATGPSDGPTAGPSSDGLRSAR